MNRPTDLKPGAETAQWVLDTVTAYPDLHYQASWATYGSECGTTRCVGGWTMYAHGVEDFMDVHGSLTVKAGELLGLNFDDADRLFYFTTEEQSVEALRYVAEGKDIPWGTVGYTGEW